MPLKPEEEDKLSRFVSNISTIINSMNETQKWRSSQIICDKPGEHVVKSRVYLEYLGRLKKDAEELTRQINGCIKIFAS
jgi:hypothetical protein